MNEWMNDWWVFFIEAGQYKVINPKIQKSTLADLWVSRHDSM